MNLTVKQLLRRVVELGRATAASELLKADAPALRALYRSLAANGPVSPLPALRIALAKVTHRTTRLALEELVDEVRR